MSLKKKKRRKNQSQSAKERRKAQELRDTFFAYLGIGLLIGLVVYNIILQIIHHP